MTSLTKEEYKKMGGVNTIPGYINTVMESKTTIIAQVYEDGLYKIKSFQKAYE